MLPASLDSSPSRAKKGSLSVRVTLNIPQRVIVEHWDGRFLTCRTGHNRHEGDVMAFISTEDTVIYQSRQSADGRDGVGTEPG